jgi:hypothetical protein
MVLSQEFLKVHRTLDYQVSAGLPGIFVWAYQSSIGENQI